MATIKQNFFYNTILNVAKVIFPFITAPYVARVLAPEGVGIFNFALVYTGYFAMVALLGIPTYGVREIAKTKNNQKALITLVSELISLSIISTIVSSIIYLLSIILIPSLSENILIFAIMGLLLFLAPLNIDWYFSGLEDFRYVTARSLFIKALCVVCIFLFVKTKDDIIIYVIINVLSNTINNLWNFIKIRNSGLKPYFTLTGLRKHIKPVMVLFASAVTVSIYTVLDTVMLGFMSNYSQVAYYSNASNISKSILAALTGFSAVAIPRISLYLKDGNKEKVNELVNKSFIVISFLSFPAATGLACISPAFAPLFYGNQFLGTIIPLQIMSFIIVAIGLNNLSGVQILIGLGKDYLFLKSVGIGAVINFCLNILLIPRFGAIGASSSSLIAETVILAVTVFFARKYTFIKLISFFEIWKSVFVSMLFIPLYKHLCSIVSGWTLVILFIIIGFIVYVLGEIALRHPAINLFYDVFRKSLKKLKNYGNYQKSNS